MNLSYLDLNVVLKVTDISKKFTRNLKTSLFYGVSDIFNELTLNRKENNPLRELEFWAVKSVVFELKRGQAIGLVGANGSGKTTLLRMISGLIKPDAGSIQIMGRVVPLIALGAGFNQILTGRENIYVNLAILGLTKQEIDAIYEDVVAFAEIGDALDAPVQTYSSGMAARLGFSCAVHAKADILLIDEVLSVGDMRFRSKCYRKLAELRLKGTSFILVSHNTNAILSICDHVIYMKKGAVILAGDPYLVMSKFEEDMTILPNNDYRGLLNRSDNENGQDIFIRKIELIEEGLHAETISTAKNAIISLEIKCNQPHSDVILSLLIRELSGETEPILHLSSDKDEQYFNIDRGVYELNMNLKVCSLVPGLYSAKIYLHKHPFYMLDAVESFIFKVRADKSYKQCLFYQSIEWTSCKLNKI